MIFKILFKKKLNAFEKKQIALEKKEKALIAQQTAVEKQQKTVEAKELSFTKENALLKNKVHVLEEQYQKAIEKLNFEQNRFKRIGYLLNNNSNADVIHFIETTKNGNTVLNALNKNEYEINVFDIDHTAFDVKEPAAWAKLWTNMRAKQIFIKEQAKYKKIGFTESAMKHLLPFAEENSKDEIAIELTNDVLNSKEKLAVIYTNLGFMLKYFSNEKQSN